MNTEFYWVAVILTTIISTARITRLAVYDKFPPVQWVRDKYLDANDGNGWALLALCGFCMSFWITALIVLWGGLAGVYVDTRPLSPTSDPVDWSFCLWWIVNGIFAMSYLAATYIANDGDVTDEPEIEDED